MKASLNPYFRPFLRETSAGLFLKLVEAILELMLPILLAQIIDIGIAGRDIPYIYGTGARMLILIVIGLICAVLCQYCAAVAAQGFGHRLRTALFRHIN
ncbi:ABC transporter ATP-binding protein, partial [Candidatus Saccharibacteria bacterium]|nr:ABC transporter ATP-binding protein [Candidatus Saccharibacteria bacterium]